MRDITKKVSAARDLGKTGEGLLQPGHKVFGLLICYQRKVRKPFKLETFGLQVFYKVLLFLTSAIEEPLL